MLLVCPGPRLHRIREAVAAIPATRRPSRGPTGCVVAVYGITPSCREGTHLTPHTVLKSRLELVCSSVHQANVRLTMCTHPLGGRSFSDLHGPVGSPQKGTFGI